MQSNMPNVLGNNLLFNVTDQRRHRSQIREETSSAQYLLQDQRNGRKRNDESQNFFRAGRSTELSQEEHKFDNRTKNKSYTDIIMNPNMSSKKSDYVEKKYGIKTLLQTKSKFVYPFNQD